MYADDSSWRYRKWYDGQEGGAIMAKEHQVLVIAKIQQALVRILALFNRRGFNVTK